MSSKYQVWRKDMRSPCKRLSLKAQLAGQSNSCSDTDLSELPVSKYRNEAFKLTPPTQDGFEAANGP